MKEKARNGYIDFLKFIFTLAIIQRHLNGIDRSFFRVMRGGNIAVEFFFCCSGFLMAFSCDKIRNADESAGKKTADYIIRKIRHLFPCYIAALILYIVYRACDNRYSFIQVIRIIRSSMASFFMLSDLGFMEEIALPFFWYVPVMLIAMTLLFPLLYKYRDLCIYVIAPLIAIFCTTYLMFTNGGIIVTAQDDSWTGFTYATLIRALAGISTGIISYALYSKISCYRGRMTAAGVFVISVIEFFSFLIPLYLMATSLKGKEHPFVVLCFIIGIAFAFSQIGISHRLFNHGIFNFLGVFSYALYLAQAVPRYLFVRFYGHMSIYRFVALYYFTTFALAAVIYLAGKWGACLFEIIKRKMAEIMLVSEN